MKQSNHMITAGVRGLVCAGMSTLITALLSLSFVVSTSTLEWMGSNALHTSQMALVQDNAGSKSVGGRA